MVSVKKAAFMQGTSTFVSKAAVLSPGLENTGIQLHISNMRVVVKCILVCEVFKMWEAFKRLKG